MLVHFGSISREEVVLVHRCCCVYIVLVDEALEQRKLMYRGTEQE